MIKLSVKLALIAFIVFSALLFVGAHKNQVLAQQTQDEVVEQLEQKVQGSGGKNDFGLPNGIKSVTEGTVNNILQTVFLLAGGLSLFFVTLGGLRYTMSDGNDQKIKQAKDSIVYSIVGLVIALSGFVIVRFLLGAIF